MQRRIRDRSGGGLRTYSRVPLHLQAKTPNSNENVKNNSNIVNGDQMYQTQP